MKKINAFIFVLLFGITLVSCSNKNEYKTIEKDVNVISLGDYSEGSSDVIKYSSYKDQSKFKLKFIENEEYIPYIDIVTYSALFGDEIYKEASILDNKDYIDLTYTIKKTSVNYKFDLAKSTVTIDGRMEDVIYSLNEGTTITSGNLEKSFNEELISGQKHYTINYSGYGFKVFREDNKTYFPFAVLDSILQPVHASRNFYNYKSIFMFSDYKALSFQKFENENKEVTTAFQEMKEKTSDAMPEYLINYNKNYFYFMFDNFYGLRVQKGIGDKMSTYFESLSYSKLLNSSSAKDRANGLSCLISGLDDGHTTVAKEGLAWGEISSMDVPQSMVSDRELLSTSFSSERKAVYKSLSLNSNGVRYSTDGKTAMITLDEFEDTSDFLNKDGKRKTDEELALTDTYFKIKCNLLEIEKKGGVENVILDMSINAGGSSEIMGKLIALLSKDNYGYEYFYDNLANSIYKETFRVDTNNDGKYDENDSFGKKFNFYLLTSPVAFSCGTAYPFLCQSQKVAKIMGTKAGGGECIIRTIILPNGQVLTHSSYVHVVKPLEKEFVGDEGAFEVDIDVNYFDYYKIDLLAKKIAEDKDE